MTSLKTLYLTLSSVFNNNPFTDDDVDDATPTSGTDADARCGGGGGLDTLLSMLQTTLQTLLEQNAHPAVVAQHFRYVFFFIGTALVNSLMDAGQSLFSSTHSVVFVFCSQLFDQRENLLLFLKR